jgi:AraC-like DNA-binding protein
MTQGRTRVEDIARRLGVGTRTMRRRLQEAGTSYTQILDHVRRSRAFLYLEEEGRTMGEIASLLGFAYQSAFNRAFKRWSGEGPRQRKTRAKA